MSEIRVNTIDTKDNTSLTIQQNNNTAITIDTSQNVLVGKTSSSTGTAGFEARSNGQTVATINGTCLIGNRLTTDGNILGLYSNGSLIGGVGSFVSRPYIASNGNSGFKFRDDLNAVIPCNNDGSNSDADQDLGTAGVRFKNLFLSGDLRIGGTGSANALDDYEEGTWSPAFSGESGSPSGVNYPTRTGYYTKIGNLVFISVDVEVSSWSSAPSGNLIITTLPFTSSGSNYQSAISISRVSGFTSTGAPSGGRIATSQTSIKLVKKASSDARDNMVTAVSSSDASGNERITLAGFYQTDS